MKGYACGCGPVPHGAGTGHAGRYHLADGFRTVHHRMGCAHGRTATLNAEQWNRFDQYKQFPQYELVNSDMDLPGFKSIFWWEYIHRNWARLIGLVFLIPFLYFWFSGRLNKAMRNRFLVVFLLGGLQGFMGWIMVASGLMDKPWVSPIT